LEKAWAKVNCSYYNIIDGNASQALEFLSPAPIELFFHDSEHEVLQNTSSRLIENSNSLFNNLLNADKANFLICCDISDKPNENKLSKLSELGLLTNHAYSVISIFELKTGEKLLKIRNPWGSFEWNGAWSDNSKKWTPEIRQEVGYLNTRNQKNDDLSDNADFLIEDGFFFMEYSDYLKFFTCTYICKINDDYEYISNKYRGNKYFKVDIPIRHSCYLIANLKNSKVVNNYLNSITKNNSKEGKYKNPLCNITVFKKEIINETSVFQYIGSTSSRLDRLHIELIDAYGTYYVEVSFPRTYNDEDIRSSQNLKTNNKLNSSISAQLFSTFEDNRNKDNNFNDSITYRFGVYSHKDSKIVFNEIEFDYSTNKSFYYEEGFKDIPNKIKKINEKNESKVEKLTIGDFAEGVYSLAAKSSNKQHFFNDGEPSSWRALTFDADDDSFGALVYRNESNATLLEVLEIKEIMNIAFVPFQLIKLPEESVFFENQAFEELHTLTKSKEIDEYYKESIEKVSNLQYCFKIPPNSIKIFMMMKTEEVASIDVVATSQLIYPTNYIIRGVKFHNLSKRLNYKDGKQVNIIETFIRYNAGSLFLFNNKTSEFKFTGVLTLENVHNIDLNEIFNQKFLNEIGNKIETVVERIKENSESKTYYKITFGLYPDEVIFFDFKSNNRTNGFEFNLNLEYKICYTEDYVSKLLS
jgi:hypothetical protein